MPWTNKSTRAHADDEREPRRQSKPSSQDPTGVTFAADLEGENVTDRQTLMTCGEMLQM